MRRLAEGGAVQDELITIRGERFVIPIKIEQKRRVQGVVHGASSSGQTVFVEPLETIDQNNELVRLLDEEHGGDSPHPVGDDAPHRRELRADPARLWTCWRELELQFAKARFAEDYNCVAGRHGRARNTWGQPPFDYAQDGPRLSGPSPARLILDQSPPSAAASAI